MFKSSTISHLSFYFSFWFLIINCAYWRETDWKSILACVLNINLSWRSYGKFTIFIQKFHGCLQVCSVMHMRTPLVADLGTLYQISTSNKFYIFMILHVRACDRMNKQKPICKISLNDTNQKHSTDPWIRLLEESGHFTRSVWTNNKKRINVE